MSKKIYALLFGVTALIIAGIVTFNILTTDNRPQVSVYTVEPQSVSDSIDCSGKIEAQSSEEIFSKYPCIASNVLVSSGDYVKKGDVLFEVDKDATREVIATSAGVSAGFISPSQLPDNVTSDIEGKISIVNVTDGGIVTTDQPCAVIIKDEDIQVQISIPENSIKYSRIGQKVLVSGPAFYKDSYVGELTHISEYARQQISGTNTETVVDAVITLHEKDESLKPGLTVKSNIEISSNDNCVIVPYSYIMQDDLNHEYVYIFENGRAVKRVIETGKEYREGFEVVSGLGLGDLIVQDVKEIKKDGQKINVIS